MNSFGIELSSSQVEIVRDGVRKDGRCMIDNSPATIPVALAIFYKDDWPVSICCTDRTKDNWNQHARELIAMGRCEILTYQSIESAHQRKFGCLILDESSMIEDCKLKITSAANRLSRKANRVIIMARSFDLTRPVDLYSRLRMIDGNFLNFKQFTQSGNWEASGQSNSQEFLSMLYEKFLAVEQTEFAEEYAAMNVHQEHKIDSDEDLLRFQAGSGTENQRR